jgi:hypothetical protein
MQTLLDSIPLYQQYVVDGGKKLSLENNVAMN